MRDLAVAVGSSDHCTGTDDAAVVLVEYGDYECPDCGEAYPVVKELQKRFGDSLRFVYRNFPLPQHEWAEMAAVTAEFAGSKDKFWQMHDALFEHQEEFSEELFSELVEDMGLRTAGLSKALDEELFEDKIDEDVRSGEESGVHGTPTFFLNGKHYSGLPTVDAMVRAVQHAVEVAAR